MTKTASENESISASVRSLFDSSAALVTVKGVFLLVFLTGIAVASVATGEAMEGVLPGAFLAVLLGVAVVYEDIRNDRVDAVGVVAIVLATVYTGLEYIGVTQGMWFPLVAAFFLLTTAGAVAWRNVEEDEETAAFVDNIDIVGLHGGILLVVYSILFAGASLEFIRSPFLPVVLLFFVLSLLGTTVAYAARSPPVEVASDELHHKLVSVVRGLGDIEDDEDRETLGQHVRSVAGSLSGIEVPSRVRLSDGRVPVVLPVSDEAVYEAHDVDDLLSELRERSLTGYAVHDDGNVLLAKEGEPVAYYVSPKDEFGTNSNVLPYGYFGDARVFTDSYAFVDSVESVLPLEGEGKAQKPSADDPTEGIEDQGDIESVLESGGVEVPDEEEVEAEAEAIAEEKDAEDIFSKPVEETEGEVVSDEVDKIGDEEETEEETERDEETDDSEEKEDESEKESDSLFEDETDISEKLDDAGDVFD